jgi:hypothetical protein
MSSPRWNMRPFERKKNSASRVLVKDIKSITLDKEDTSLWCKFYVFPNLPSHT